MNLKKYKKILFITLLFVIILSPILTSARQLGNPDGGGGVQNPDGGGGVQNPTGIENPIEADSIQELISAILGIIVQIGVPVVIFFIIYAGFLFVTAQGNSTKLETAKATFLYTVIGAVILLGAEMISRIIETTVNEIRDGTSIILEIEDRDV